MTALMPSRIATGLLKRYLGRADVMLSVCAHRHFDIDSMTTAMQLFAQKRHDFTWAPVRGDALISRARSRAASHFLKTGSDVLFFLDDDIVFKTEDALKLVDACIERKAIVGGMYVQKRTVDKTAVFYPGQAVRFAADAEPEPVPVLPTGFMAIHREALLKIVEAAERPLPNGDKLLHHCYAKDPAYAYYNFFNPFTEEKDGQTVDLSEDWSFCTRATIAGVGSWLLPSIFLQHKGEYLFDLADKLLPKKQPLDQIEVTIQ